MNYNPINLGIIGLGKMGQNHLRNLSVMKQFNVVFVYDPNIEVCNKVTQLFGYNCSNDLASDLRKVDAVIIVAPTIMHAYYIKMASNYVKYIFVEKPLTDTLNSSKLVCKIAEKKNVEIQVGFIERYNTAINTLKEILSKSDKIINIDFVRTNKLSNRIIDVDVISDLMIHDIDLALYLNGPVESVEAYGYAQDEQIEFARATIKHKSGVYSNLLASRVTEKRIRQIHATCIDMFVDCNLLSKEVVINRQTVEQYINNISIASKSETISVSPQEGLLLELLDFSNLCIGLKATNLPTAIDGLNAIAIADYIRKKIIYKKQS